MYVSLSFLNSDSNIHVENRNFYVFTDPIEGDPSEFLWYLVRENSTYGATRSRKIAV